MNHAPPPSPSQSNKHRLRRKVEWLVCYCVAVICLVGCATSSRPPATGEGIREYRRMVLDLHNRVEATRQSVETVAVASESELPAAYAHFAAALQRLEVTSIQARARTEAMATRGEAYFDEWAEDIRSAAGESTRETQQARFLEWRVQFQGILSGVREVRQEFRPFLEGLRRQRSALGDSPASDALQKARPEFQSLAEAGRRTEVALDRLLNELHAGEALVSSAVKGSK